MGIKGASIGAGGLALLAFVVYVATMTPTVFWGDSAEFTTSAYLLGIPHPTGYPLYLLLNRLFISAVPLGDIAYRTNLFSAASGAITTGILFLVVVRLAGDLRVAAITSLTFAFTYRFWRESIVTEVYTLHALFLASILFCLLLWRDTEQKRYVYLSFLTFGLSLAHHGMTVLLIPPLLYGVFFLRKERLKAKELAMASGMALVGLPFYVYLPLRYLQDPTLNLAKMVGVDLTRPTELWWFMSGGLFRSEMTSWSLGRIYSQLGEGLAALTADLLIVGALLAYLGAVMQYKREPKTFRLILLTFIPNLAFVALYRVPDIADFAVFLSLIASLWLGVGLAYVSSWLSNLVKRMGRPLGPLSWPATHLPFLAMGILPLAIFMSNIRHLDYSDKYAARDYAREVLASMPEGAVLFMQFPAAPLWYAQMVEGMRPDVTLIDRGLAFLQKRAFSGITKREGIISAVNQELIDRYKERPLFIISYDPDIASEWNFEDQGVFYRLSNKGLPIVRNLDGEEASRGPVFGDSLRLYDTSWESSRTLAGKLINIKLKWIVEKSPAWDLKLIFRFESLSRNEKERETGAFEYEIRQGHGTLGTKEWPVGRLVEESYDLYIPIDAEMGPYLLVLMLADSDRILPAYDPSEPSRADGRDISPYLGAVLGEITVEKPKTR